MPRVERRPGGPGDELAALAQLRQDEAVLDRRLEEARAEAGHTVAAAVVEAERLRAEARRLLAEELAARAARLDGACAEAAARARAEVEGRVAELDRHAAAAHDAALRLLVEAVSGGAP